MNEMRNKVASFLLSLVSDWEDEAAPTLVYIWTTR